MKRVKDRFTPGNETTGGWRDALINGYFRSDRNMHVVEIQIHHKALLTVRKDLGGHFMYSKFRAVAEALETAGVQIDTSFSNKEKSKVLVMEPSPITHRHRFQTAPNLRLASKKKLKLRPKSNTKTKTKLKLKKKKKKAVFERPRFTTAPGLVRSRRRSKEKSSFLKSSCESKYEEMDISPRKEFNDVDDKDTTNISSRKQQRKDKTKLRSGAQKILSMSPTRRLNALESLLSESPSRQKLVNRLLKGTPEEIERFRRESRGESFCGDSDSSGGRFSSFSTTPPKSPMVSLRSPGQTAKKAGSKILKRSPIKVEFSSGSLTTPGLTASLSGEFSPSPPESPFARMRGLRKSPVTVMRYGDEEDSREESKLRSSLDFVQNTPPSPLIRKKAPSLTLDQERERSPQKKVRKNPKNVL